MRTILLIILMLSSGILVSPQAGTKTDPANLKMLTSILDQKYCDGGYSDMAMMRLSLRLTYINAGRRPLILYKGSNLIHYILVSPDERSLGNKQYELDLHVGWVTSELKVDEGDKPGEIFVVLNPGESYQTEGDVSIPVGLEPHTKFLKAGEHVIAVITETWPGSEAQFNKLQKKWSGTGVLWGRNVRSEPMPFSVVKIPRIVVCD